MSLATTQCLILACGNTLREDDGVGPWLAAWAEDRFRAEAGVHLISRQQWTPELAEFLAAAESVLFIDCAASFAPGLVRLAPVAANDATEAVGTHHLGAAELLALSQELYGATPRSSLLLTVGAGSFALREGFSDTVTAALPDACSLLESTILRQLARSSVLAA